MAVSIAMAQSPRAAHHAKPAAAIADFESRVNQYLDARKGEAGKTPGPTKSAAKLTESQEEMRARLQVSRKDAKQGDIFTPEISKYFRKQIAGVFQGARGTRILKSLRRAEPTKEVPLKVNEPYPDGMAFQSMPPTLLLKLPQLPKELEYRIVGNNLILRDAGPNLVVDVLPDALPKT
jgi:hypothetical protein